MCRSGLIDTEYSLLIATSAMKALGSLIAEARAISVSSEELGAVFTVLADYVDGAREHLLEAIEKAD